MPTQDLEKVLEQYSEAIKNLEKAEKADENELLTALLARDRIVVLKEEFLLTPYQLQKISSSDQLLKNIAQKNTLPLTNLPSLRKSYHPNDGAWWWFLDNEATLYKPHKNEEIYKWLAVTALTIAGALAVDISRRFLAGGPDWVGALAVIWQAFILLMGAGALRNISQELANRSLESFSIHKRMSTGLIVSLIILAFMLFFRLYLLQPMAQYFNNVGRELHRAGNLLGAEYHFQRAVNLRPDYAPAHYNYGLLYEDLLDEAQARVEYQIAAKNGEIRAYNNLARLYIIDGQPEKAVDLLLEALERGLDFADEDREDLYFNLQKNLGWARVSQERFVEAEIRLLEALRIDENQASAHCLMAQTLDGLGQPDAALAEWEKCRALVAKEILEEDEWFHMAQNRLAED